MKPYFSFFLVFIFLVCCRTISNNSFDYYITNSRFKYNDRNKYFKWSEINKDTVVYSFQYFRGDCCGSVPIPTEIKAKISNDTIYINYGLHSIENCDKSVGICGSFPELVMNKKKYPNYKKFKIVVKR